jgi:hypothetical protein
LFGFDPLEWEANLAIIRAAQADRDPHTPWFFRRLVEIEREVFSPRTAQELDWALGLAGLPVLGHKFGCLQQCEDLAALMREHSPWAGGIVGDAAAKLGRTTAPGRGNTQRARYLTAAKQIGQTIRECFRVAQAVHARSTVSQNMLGPTPVLLAAFHERIPVFDRPRRYRKFRPGSIILGLCAVSEGA